MEKIKKIANVLNRWFGFTKYVYIGLIILSLISIFSLVFVLNETQISYVVSEFSLDYLTFEFTESTFKSVTSAKLYLIIQIITSTVFIILSIKVIDHVRMILNIMIEGNVFKEEMAKNIMELSFIVFIMGVFGNLALYVDYRVMINSNLISLFESNQNIVNVSNSYNFDFSFIIQSGVLYLLAYVFNYGVELQTLSDETL